ncbi:hypothetical protein EDL99_11105 [Ornithobacterium rhinotracheale]|uniref:hypothetical protein n=1 Tax=Ornithobacterium rhinotracheale TaxID=28251 RepID=UPI00129C2C46|nr:hypothetical protein [Ornithobacterium rhinotracheale]MRJ09399.1 hypothetical protein [Ornithobacterium rhinotracheale]UOH78744.1 hypothetical protein MT996_04545 [Ornithobacterium rhinotracheale]
MNSITPQQLKQLQTICSKRFSDREERLHFFSEFTGFTIKSTKDLTERQAYELIRYLNTGKEPKNSLYALFSMANSQHRAVISRAYQLCWTEEDNERKVDLNKLGTWLISKRCPVNKPIMKMTKRELSKVIYVLDQLVKWKNGKNKS